MIKVELKVKINIFRHVPSPLRKSKDDWLADSADTESVTQTDDKQQVDTHFSTVMTVLAAKESRSESRSENDMSRELRQRLILETTPECLHKCFLIPALGEAIGAQHITLLPNQHLEVIMSALPSADAGTEAGRDQLIITPPIMDAGLRRAAGGARPMGRNN